MKEWTPILKSPSEMGDLKKKKKLKLLQNAVKELWSRIIGFTFDL